MKQLLELPQEIILNILTLLRWKDVITCRMVCRILNEVFKSSAALRLTVELATAGLVSSPVSATPTNQCLSALKNHQRAWGSLKFSRKDFIQDNHMWPAYDLQKGLFTRGVATHPGRPEISSEIHFTVLPTTFPVPADAKTWIRGYPDILVSDFTTDPHLDLIVLAEAYPIGPTHEVRLLTDSNPQVETTIARLHFRTISTNISHPLAKGAFIEFGSGPSDLHFYALVLRGGLIACVLRRGAPANFDSVLYIWRWTSGELLKVIESPGTLTVIFLDDDTLLVGVNDVQIHLWRLEVHSITPDTPVVSLRLPPITPIRGNSIMGMLLRADPNTTTSIGPSFQPCIDPASQPFQATAEDRLIALTFTGHSWSPWDPLPQINRFIVFLRSSPIQELAAKKASNLLNEPPSKPAATITVPWMEWGPKNTRWSREIARNDFVCNIYGHRFVTFSPFNPGRVSILDFNPFALRLHRDDPSMPASVQWPESESARSAIIDQDTIMARPSLFQHPVESRLPYRETMAMLPTQHDPTGSLMLDNDRILHFMDTAEGVVLEIFTV